MTQASTNANECTFEVKTFKEHVRSRSMWLGSTEPVKNSYFVYKNNTKTLSNEKLEFSEALLKVFDELIVNVIDQWSLNICKKITCSWKDNTFTITNVGSNIPIQVVPSQNNKYTIELLFTKEYCGTNFTDSKDKITGGVNGLGLKLVTNYSNYMSIKACNNCIEYFQEFLNGGDIIKDPIIKKASSATHSYTTVTFKPNIALLCKDCNMDNNVIESLIMLRLLQTTLFLNTLEYKHQNDNHVKLSPIKISYNDVIIPSHTLKTFATMLGITKYVLLTFNKSTHNKFPWYVLIGENNIIKKYESMSVINGVYVKNGSHLSTLYKQIFKYVTEKKKINITEIVFLNTMFIIDCKHIPLVSFSSQSKTSFNLGKKVLNEMKTEFVLTNSQLEEIFSILASKLKIKEKVKTIDLKSIANKYVRAFHTGPSSTLFIQEGDSAELAVNSMLLKENPTYKKEYCGRFNLNGVPLNILKQIASDIITSQDPSSQDNITGIVNLTAYDISEILKNNKTLIALAHYIGLEINKEPKNLNYGEIVIVTDEDIDGKGHICSLLLVYFIVFWPKLFTSKIIKRLHTPIIRVFKGKSIECFYSLDEFKNSKYQEDDRGCDIQYYKGLATHSKRDLQEMSNTMKDNMFLFELTDECREIMIKYYGNSTIERKRILLAEEKHLYDKLLYKKKTIRCKDHFNIETKDFQLEFISRKFKSIYDGMIESSRKVFACTRKSVSHSIKVFQLGGLVAADMNYFHGDTSLNGTITKQAQAYIGSNNIPFLIGLSSGFGDRKKSRKHTAQPRYLNIKYNDIMDLIFPKCDDCLLEYVYEEGKKCQPTYYVSVIPLCILEFCTTPAAGWKCNIYPRNLTDVIKYVKDKINGKNVGVPIFKPWSYNNVGNVKKCECLFEKRDFPIRCKNFNNKEIYYGDYMIVGNAIHIRQLPPKLWEENYVNNIKDLSFCNECLFRDTKYYSHHVCENIKIIKKLDSRGSANTTSANNVDESNYSIKKYSVDNDIHIIIELIDASYFTLLKLLPTVYPLDPIVEHFKLYEIVTPQINLLNRENKIHEFSVSKNGIFIDFNLSYKNVIDEWFTERLSLYEKRYNRLKILLELNILFYKNVKRFIEMDIKKEFDINYKTHEVRYKILKENNFIHINENLLKNSDNIKTSLLKETILDNTSYNYIDKIQVKQRSSEEIEKLKLKITKLETDLKNFPTPQQLWIQEIDVALEKIIKRCNEYWE